jgi:hypothetical protein
MEAATTPDQPALVQEPPAPQEVAAAEHSPGEQRTPDRIFRLSTYLHVGVGAEECEHREDGKCQDPQHFHAWCRLPNQFQHDSIREKALAAKARRIRVLKDPESDAYTIVEFALDELRATGDRETLIEEVIQKDTFRNFMAVVNELKDEEEFKTADEDRERLRALEEMPEESRPADEYNELAKHVAEFDALIKQRRDEIEAPMREGLQQNDMEALIDMARQDRIEKDGARAFMDAFSRWEWFFGTMKPKDPDKPGFPSERSFSSIEHMESAADEVLNALDNTFGNLEATLASGKGS